MNPWKVSAQFAAFVWYLERKTKEEPTQDEAVRFAKDNWIAFLPSANEGIGRLLIKIGGPKAARMPRKFRRRLGAAHHAAEADSAVA
jgi:hypothetical protein